MSIFERWGAEIAFALVAVAAIIIGFLEGM